MSKKYHNPNHANNPGASVHSVEYGIIKKDLIKVLFLNLVYLAAVLALYYTNLKTHYLDNWFAKIFHF
jgi:hypothetical protein